jgi:phage gp36-like protein
MANPLAVNLSPATAITAAGESAAIDLGTTAPRNAARLTAKVVSWVDGQAGQSSVALVLQTSPDGSTWSDVERLSLSNLGVVEWGAFGLGRYIRLTWAPTGLTSAVLSVAGFAETAFCSPADLKNYGLPPGALEKANLRKLLDYCLAVTDEADGYLAAVYTLPIVAWSEDLKLHCSKRAIRFLLDWLGWDPEGRDETIELAHQQAHTWLKDVARGTCRPPGIIDTAPEVFEAGSVVVSRARRDNSWL